MQQRCDLRRSRLAAAALVLCLLTGTAYAHQQKDLEPEDQAQAQKWVEEGLNHFKNVKVTEQYISFSDAQKNYVIPLGRIYWTNYTEKTTGRSLYELVQWKDYAQDPLIGFVQERYTRGNEKHMQRFKAALDYLAAEARQQTKSQYDAQFEQFKSQAKTWRELATKPLMPESAREHQVLAEYAFKEKDTDKAIREYTAALEIFPTWPEGQFNLATLAGEKQFYETAILHMKEYLELVPESADAQAAKDSIIIWKDKVSTLYSADVSNGSTPQLKNVSSRSK
jgi:tetratricopeptide (TPR) repeat protein